jgi:hypothetical protein
MAPRVPRTFFLPGQVAMRPRLLVAFFAGMFSLTTTASAQLVTPADPYADGLIPGGYLRLAAGVLSPINPSGTLRDWNSAPMASLIWENWQPSAHGVGRVGFGIGLGYSALPLNSAEFASSFVPASGTVSTATGKNASILQVETSIRVRIPSPFIMPSLEVGFGFLSFHPGQIDYTTSDGTTGSARSQTRSGAEFSIGGGLDKQIAGRAAIFGEAMYEYGLTGLGHGIAEPGGTCASGQCDVLKNMSLGIVRGGLRVRLGS